MLSVEQYRKIDPTLNDLTDEEIREIRDAQHKLAKLAFEKWRKEKLDGKA